MRQAIFVAGVLLALLSPLRAFGTADYARQTGKECSYCHVDPSGGGMLTAAGEKFKDELRIKGLYRPLTRVQRIIRLIVGFLHTMTAIAWFGAILYVHILLKPAYAARGLPRGELLLGWFSIGIMTVTGGLLTIARVPSLAMMLHSRFGILLLVKILLFLVLVFTAAVVTFVIGPRLKKREGRDVPLGKRDLTKGELEQCDGKNGNPAYVAYAGSIYDVGGSKLWRGGAHARKHLAGTDLTDALKQAPHGEEKLESMSLVGKIVESRHTVPAHQRVFYFFAYMNLIIIFLIVFVISLWRWW